MNENELTYWISLYHDLPSWSFSNRNGRKNEDKMDLVIKFFNNGLSIVDFFGLSFDFLKSEYSLNDSQINDLACLKSRLSNNTFLVESLMNKGISIIPVISSDYPRLLKKRLLKSSPLLVYIKGNPELLNESSIGVVGSRNASDMAFDFTKNVIERNKGRVVISGGAKGVDQFALESCLSIGGKSVVVIPQGILTYDSGINKYYKGLVEGRVLIISTFHPNTPWQKELAMARNSIIYSLSEKIYVAESTPSVNRSGKVTKGGTYSGVLDGLNKIKKGILDKGSIMVRKPGDFEDNDNIDLIKLGGVPVDINGELIDLDVGGNLEPLQLSLF